MVTGDSQEEVIIFRDKQTDMHHNIYIIIIVMVIDLVGGVGGGGRLVNRFSDALVVVFEVGALVLFVVAFVEVFFSSSFS